MPSNLKVQSKFAPRHAQRDLRKVWLLIGAGITGLVLTLSFMLPAPGTAMPVWSRPVLAAVSGGGLGLPLAAVWVHRADLRRMLRFTRGRIIATLIMAGLFPVGFFGGLPTAFGFWVALVLSAVAGGLQETFSGSGGSIPGFAAVFCLINALAYAASAALIHSLARRWRIAGFSLLYIGQIALLLALGFYRSQKL